MDTEPASGPAWDDDPAPDSDWPGRSTPDRMDEAEWKRYCATGDEDPPGADEELDPEDGSAAEMPLEVITAQARADEAAKHVAEATDNAGIAVEVFKHSSLLSALSFQPKPALGN